MAVSWTTLSFSFRDEHRLSAMENFSEANEKVLRDRRNTSGTRRPKKLFGYCGSMNYETKRMFRAIHKNRVGSVKLLLKTGKVNLEAREGYPRNSYLHLSAHYGNVTITKLLLEAGCRANAWNSKYCTPLHMSMNLAVVSLNDRLSIIQSLLDHGGVVNVTNSDGDTPLHLLAKNSICMNEKNVALLVKYGADLSRKNKEGKMPFQEYIFAQEIFFGADQRLLTLLLPDADRHELSPMHEACLFHRLKIVMDMLKNGAEVDEKDKFGRSPLYYALMARNIGTSDQEKKSVVRLLLDNGADINQKFCEIRFRVENLIVDLAFNMGNTEIFEIFLEHAAKLLMLFPMVSDQHRMIYVNYFRYMHIDAFQTSTMRCYNEVMAMKKSKLGPISFFNLMTENSEKMMIYARNQETVQAFENSGYETRFPIFQGMLRANFNRGFVRLKLMKDAAVVLSEVLRFTGPENPVFEMMLDHFSDDELKFLIRSA